MAALPAISVASIIIGFISFFFTLLTWLGVYISLIKTIRTAPNEIPITLGNLHQEIQSERSMLRERIKEGDKYHVFPGRQFRRVGKNESHIRLLEYTMKQLWKSFRELEKEFLVDQSGRDVEDVKSDDSESQFENEKGEEAGRRSGEYTGNGRVRDRRRMRRRESHIQGRMGMSEAGLGNDRQTYYNTDLKHRIVWWWKRDDVNNMLQQVQRLQIRRVEADLYETDMLVKRGIVILGNMSGEDPYEDCGEGKGPQGKGPDDSGGARRRRKKYARSHNPRTSRAGFARSRDTSGTATREVYERDIRRIRRQSTSDDSVSEADRESRPASRRANGLAGSTVSAARGTTVRSRSRAPSVVEYEVVNPGRVWVDVERTSDRDVRSSHVEMDRPQPAHFTSYVRDRPSARRLRQQR